MPVVPFFLTERSCIRASYMNSESSSFQNVFFLFLFLFLFCGMFLFEKFRSAQFDSAKHLFFFRMFNKYWRMTMLLVQKIERKSRKKNVHTRTRQCREEVMSVTSGCPKVDCGVVSFSWSTSHSICAPLILFLHALLDGSHFSHPAWSCTSREKKRLEVFYKKEREEET